MMVFESDSELGEFFRVLKSRLGIRVSCRKKKDFDDHTYILRVNTTEDDTPVLHWFGESPLDCANQMMNTFSRTRIQTGDGKIFLPEFDSIEELEMKLDLMGR